MENKNEFKKIDIEDIRNCSCYHFDDIIKAIDINFNDTLLDETLYKENYKNISICKISCKKSTGAKPLCVRWIY